VLFAPAVVHHPKMQCDLEAFVVRAARLRFANINTCFDSSRTDVAMFVCAL